MNSLFLDSGAFSAYTQKKSDVLNIDEYIEYIKQNEKHITVYANLDVIGDPEATWENQRYMESKGLNPLPIFHMNDTFDYLERCLQYDYFGVGGSAVEKNKSQRKQFFDSVWFFITDDKGFPLSKVHGLGITSPEFIAMYPWYSVDSASWTYFGRYGKCIMPKTNRGKFDYGKNFVTVATSYRISPDTCGADMHISTMTGIERDVFYKYCTDRNIPIGESTFFQADEKYELKENEVFVNKTYEVETIIEPGVRNNSIIRDHLNVLFYMDLSKSQPEYPWAFKQKQRGSMF